MVSAKLSPWQAQFTPCSAFAGVEANALMPPAEAEPFVLSLLVVVVVCLTAASFLQPYITNAVAKISINFFIAIPGFTCDRLKTDEVITKWEE
jgi:hypothetical protein